MVAELYAMNECAKQHGIDSAAAFSRKHRLRLQRRRNDPNPETTAELRFSSFYRKETRVALDSLITEYDENIKVYKKLRHWQWLAATAQKDQLRKNSRSLQIFSTRISN